MSEAESSEVITPYGRNFARAMRFADASQSDIAELVNARGLSTISNWLKRGVPRRHEVKVAEFLRVDPAKICPQFTSSTHERGELIDDYVQNVVEDRAANARAGAASVKGKARVVADHEARYSVRDYRRDRLIEIIQHSRLSHRDMDLIEDLIERLSRR